MRAGTSDGWRYVNCKIRQTHCTITALSITSDLTIICPQQLMHSTNISPGAERDFRNDIGPVTRGNNVKCIGTLCEMRYIHCKNEILLLLLLLLDTFG